MAELLPFKVEGNVFTLHYRDAAGEIVEEVYTLDHEDDRRTIAEKLEELGREWRLRFPDQSSSRAAFYSPDGQKIAKKEALAIMNPSE